MAGEVTGDRAGRCGALWGAGHVSSGVEETVPGCRYNVGRFSVWMTFRRGRVTVGRPGRFRYDTSGRERVSGCWK